MVVIKRLAMRNEASYEPCEAYNCAEINNKSGLPLLLRYKKAPEKFLREKKKIKYVNYS